LANSAPELKGKEKRFGFSIGQLNSIYGAVSSSGETARVYLWNKSIFYANNNCGGYHTRQGDFARGKIKIVITGFQKVNIYQ